MTKAMDSEKLVEIFSRQKSPGAIRQFKNTVDWDGIHVVGLHFLHGDGEDVRFTLMIKVRDSDEPVNMIFTIPTEEFNSLPDLTVEGVS